MYYAQPIFDDTRGLLMVRWIYRNLRSRNNGAVVRWKEGSRADDVAFRETEIERKRNTARDKDTTEMTRE